MISRASAILRYDWELWEHYLSVHVLVSDKFLPWGGWKPTLTPTPTMILEKFNGIVLMYVHQEIVFDIENVIDRLSLLNRTTFEFYWNLGQNN